LRFKDFELHSELHKAIERAGWVEPTPVQAEAIPAILKGSDLMGLAQTGTGKTAAFALPILQRLLTGKQKQVRALIIAPTRELAEQLNSDISQLASELSIRSQTVYGGMSFRNQMVALKEGVEIVVATPGRLLDHLQRRTIDLRGVEMLVLDEADRMFDMGFLPDIRKIMRQLPEQRQNLLFSATMPFAVRSLADDILNDPVVIQIDFARPAVTVTHALYEAENYIKSALLRELLKKTTTESVLIFTRTKHRASEVARQLKQDGFHATSLQGDLTQYKRQKALNSFREGRIQILVATDIAARGLDISLVSHVINYDMPATADDYTHRIGRTGRASRSGDAFTFVTHEDQKMVRVIEQVLGEKLERLKLPEIDYTPPGPVTRKPLTTTGVAGSQARYRRGSSRAGSRRGDR
jgi:ATP-dependent RNA helicase RhlE